VARGDIKVAPVPPALGYCPLSLCHAGNKESAPSNIPGEALLSGRKLLN